MDDQTRQPTESSYQCGHSRHSATTINLYSRTVQRWKMHCIQCTFNEK